MTLIKFILIYILITASSAFSVETFWPGKTMNAQQISEKWGRQPLNIERFREGDVMIRATMAFDLVSQQTKYVGKSMSEIKKMFGSYDGHYFNDWIPAYIIQEGQKKGDETWQIVFLPDKEKKVSKIIVHKNCCE